MGGCVGKSSKQVKQPVVVVRKPERPTASSSQQISQLKPEDEKNENMNEKNTQVVEINNESTIENRSPRLKPDPNSSTSFLQTQANASPLLQKIKVDKEYEIDEKDVEILRNIY